MERNVENKEFSSYCARKSSPKVVKRKEETVQSGVEWKQDIHLYIYPRWPDMSHFSARFINSNLLLQRMSTLCATKLKKKKSIVNGKTAHFCRPESDRLFIPSAEQLLNQSTIGCNEVSGKERGTRHWIQTLYTLHDGFRWHKALRPRSGYSTNYIIPLCYGIV